VNGAILFLAIGVLLVTVAAIGSVVRRMPLTTSMLYLAAGVLLGPAAADVVRINPFVHAAWIERLSEVAVLISLFVAGLKLRAPLHDRLWRLPFRLATVSMTLTVMAIAAVGVWGFGLSLGAAVLLGAVLAPTDPVLASDVQVEHPTDRDRLRFSLTGEAGLNDGTAFPFIMLGLGLLGAHDLGALGWRWLLVDVVWAIGAGLAVGWGAAWLVARGVLWLRREKQEGVGLDDLFALGVIALACGAALLIRSYAFLAVFAAGLALRREERRHTEHRTGSDDLPDLRSAIAEGAVDDVATARDTAPAFLASAALHFTERVERLMEITLMFLLGAMLTVWTFELRVWWFALALLLVIRPLAVWLGAPLHASPLLQRRLMMWFGIRGIGSIYYLSFALTHGLVGTEAHVLVEIVFTTIVVSVVLHGTSVTPLMNRYGARVREEDERTGVPGNSSPSV
jgi:sodium/hydrogen antiporter